MLNLSRMSILPKTSAKPPQEGTLSPGTLVMYENQGAGLIGAIVTFKKPKYLVLNERGAEVELAADRLHQLPSSLPADLATSQDKTKYLSDLSAKAKTDALSLDLEELWSLIFEEDREYKNSELCALYFGKDEIHDHLMLRLALLCDSIYFKRKKEFFIPRPPLVVDELKRAEESKRKRLEAQESALRHFADRLENPQAPLPATLNFYLTLLKDTAVNSPNLDPSRQKEAKELLDACQEKLKLGLNGQRPEQAYQLLRHLGEFSDLTNPAIIRNNIRPEFPEAVLKQAAEISIPSLEQCPDREIRLDLTALPAFTVDDHNTKDMDDAISIERTPTGYRLGVHISDVAALLPPDSSVDLEARRRTTSFYFADGPINMLPESLSQQTCSLVENQARLCLSCLWDVDYNFNVSNGQISPSVISVKKRYSYEEVDKLLETSDSDLNILYNIASGCEALRVTAGGFKVNKREVMVVLKEDGELGLVEMDENAPGHSLIGEMMVLCNQFIADFAIKHNIPIVFRGQPPSEAPDQSVLEKIPQGPARDYAIRTTLKPSSLSFDPIPHSTLGIAAYTQATSPIRRYLDLCNQRQILWFLRHGQPCYSRSEYEKLISETEEFRAAAGMLVRESRRFWLLKYLERRMTQSRTIQATVLRTDFKTPMVELDEVFLPTLVKLPGGAKPGDVVNLRITRIDAAFDDLRLEVAQ
ncbi:MAG: RNB domain-containing ribonuclease [Deltaproteobacteria bacterium]|nr:RNB domain-containing ribonuclease [Deltaproteobacteria bacterium]